MPENKVAAVILASILCSLSCSGFAASVRPSETDARQSADCSILAPWIQAKARRSTLGGRVADWALQQKQEWEGLQLAAAHVFDQYLQGKLDSANLETCLGKGEGRDAFETALPEVFFSRSLDLLLKGTEGLPDSAVHRLAVRVQENQKNGNDVFFRLSGHFFKHPENAPLLGGFHRGSGSIFMDFQRIPPSEWLLVFTHELTHAVDQRLREATSEYNALAGADFSHHPAALRKWLLAGLDRGYFAEARAWTLTARYYVEGLKAGLWPEIPWMERMLKFCGTRKPGLADLLRYLDSSFVDPHDGPFADPQISTALSELRQQVRQGKLVPRMGDSLASLLSD